MMISFTAASYQLMLTALEERRDRLSREIAGDPNVIFEIHQIIVLIDKVEQALEITKVAA